MTFEDWLDSNEEVRRYGYINLSGRDFREYSDLLKKVWDAGRVELRKQIELENELGERITKRFPAEDEAT
jgi:hypothetical protein